MSESTFLTRVTLKNYKSIAVCRVELRPLMFLVGRNGAGKSNFLDALRFVSDALNNPLDHAIRQRNGIKEVRRRSGGHPTHFSMRLEFRLSTHITGHYAFRIGATPQGGFEVQSEECRLNTIEVTTEEQRLNSTGFYTEGAYCCTSHCTADRTYFALQSCEAAGS